jgi:hypothetical protein
MEHVLSEETLKKMKALTLSLQKKPRKAKRRKPSEAPAG